MECLFLISFSSSILLACYDGTCYLDETLHCNMYVQLPNGCNLCVCATSIWLQLAMYEWMELYMYVRWNLCAGYVIWKYIYICHIYFLCKLWDLIKNRKNRQYAGSLPSATDGKGLFAISSGRQRGHVAGNCASWEADQFGQFAHSGWRHRLCRLQRTAKACR